MQKRSSQQLKNTRDRSDVVLEELEKLRKIKADMALKERELREQLRDAKEKKKAYKALLLAYEEEIWRLRGQLEALSPGSTTGTPKQLVPVPNSAIKSVSTSNGTISSRRSKKDDGTSSSRKR